MNRRRNVAIVILLAWLVIGPVLLWRYRWWSIQPPTIECATLDDDRCYVSLAYIESWMPADIRPVRVVFSANPGPGETWHVRVDPFLGEPVDGACSFEDAGVTCGFE